MKRTTSLITAGALTLGTTALLGSVASGTASASGCGVTTLDMVGLQSTFNGALSGVGGGATAHGRREVDVVQGVAGVAE